ncbi:MAG TPA: preprotein translocase subunit SecE [Conexibacter sp.]|nr:preprotein translocase subunit SecE [Conexibacter sp.]
MARDRRRAKQRRDRQARSGGGAQARRTDSAAPTPDAPHDAEHVHDYEPPELATGDRDLVEAQLEIGRPELTDAAGDIVGTPDVIDDPTDLPELTDEDQFEALEDRVDDAEERFEEGQPYDDGERAEEGAVAVRSRRRAPARAKEEREGNRLATFLRGSWRELQRVQWPDRRQVGQATAVVIGFVIVAGAYLGVADYVAGKIVELII